MPVASHPGLGRTVPLRRWPKAPSRPAVFLEWHDRHMAVVFAGSRAAPPAARDTVWSTNVAGEVQPGTWHRGCARRTDARKARHAGEL